MGDFHSAEVLREHLDRNPNIQHAALHDPQFAAELHRLWSILGHLDTTLLTEGAGEEQRRRIAAGVVAKCLDPVEAATRVREHAARVEDLAWNRCAASHTGTAENNPENHDHDLRADALRALSVGMTIPESIAQHLSDNFLQGLPESLTQQLSDDFLQELAKANDAPATPGATQ